MTGFVLPQHPDEHGPEHRILLDVDQQLAEEPRLWVRPELSDPLGAFEIRQSQDVE